VYGDGSPPAHRGITLSPVAHPSRARSGRRDSPITTGRAMSRPSCPKFCSRPKSVITSLSPSLTVIGARSEFVVASLGLGGESSGRRDSVRREPFYWFAGFHWSSAGGCHRYDYRSDLQDGFGSFKEGLGLPCVIATREVIQSSEMVNCYTVEAYGALGSCGISSPHSELKIPR
jgi:hypothetical protein